MLRPVLGLGLMWRDKYRRRGAFAPRSSKPWLRRAFAVSKEIGKMRVLLALVALVSIILGLIAVPSWAQDVREPAFDGKSLGEWIAQLKSVEVRARQAAASALGRMGPNAVAAVSGLTETLNDQSPQVRFQSAIALGCIGPEAKASIPALVVALSDRVFFVRYWAAFALGEIGPDAETALPALKEALVREDDVFARRGIVTAVARLGPVAPRASAMVLNEKNTSEKPPESKPVDQWVDQLKSPDVTKRIEAFEALRRLGPQAKAAVLPLSEALRDPSPATRWRAAITLGCIGPEAKAAVRQLADALKDDYYPARYYVAFALGEIGLEAKTALPALNQALMHEEVEYVRRGIASALSRVGPDAVPGLVEALTNSSASVRQAAILALGQMGPEAKRAAPALTEALHDKEGFVRSAAGVAIKRVDPMGEYVREKY
jgi:HEAT repeat protein